MTDDLPFDPVHEVRWDPTGWPVTAAGAALHGLTRRYPAATIRNGPGHYIIRLGDERPDEDGQAVRSWDEYLAGQAADSKTRQDHGWDAHQRAIERLGQVLGEEEEPGLVAVARRLVAACQTLLAETSHGRLNISDETLAELDSAADQTGALLDDL